MATRTQIKRRGRLSLILGTLVAAVAFAAVAYASDVDVAVVDVTVPTSSVALAAGGSGSITINMSVTGNQAGTATFEVYRDWTLSGGVFTGSNPQEFTVGPRAGGDPATTFSTTGTVSVAAGQATGTFTLAASVFDITNSNATGAKLAAGDASNYVVTVTAPADTTPPSVQGNVNPAPNADGWNNTTPVELTWSISDPDSATSIVSGCVDETFNAETAGATRSCTASSAGGTTGLVSVTIKIDKTKPLITGGTGSYTPGTWTNQSVVVSFSCAEAGPVQSGVKTNTVAGATVSTSGANQSVTNTGACNDYAGNSADAATVGDIDIDKVAPTVSCNAASFLLNQPGAQVSASVTDQATLSGALNSTEYGAADTTSVGSKSVNITGYDNAGNSTTVSCAYTVGYRFDGLYAPVDKPNTLNVSKAGQAVPLKWRLTDYNNDPVTTLTSVVVSVTNTSCALGVSEDLVEEIASGSSGLQNLGDGYYQFNWKTPTSYAGSCKWVNLKLGDETTRMGLAYFSFKK